MKKILLIASFIFLSIVSFAQNTEWESYRSQVGKWDSYQQKWVYADMNYSVIPITFSKTEVRLQNKANSVFRIIEDDGVTEDYNNNGDKFKKNSWIAIDTEGRKCRISMIHFYSTEYDPLMFNVMYDDVLFRYYCRLANTIDSFNRQ